MAETLKQEAQRLLSNVPETYAFHSTTGRVLYNMNDLGEELKAMEDDSYALHVNNTKNDFINWVRDIIKDESLARDLLRSKDRVQAAKAVATRLARLNKRASEPVRRRTKT